MDNFQYTPTSFTKKEFLIYFKSFLKKIKKKLKKDDPDAVKPFQAGAGEFGKFVIANFEEMEFFAPESGTMEGTMIYSYYPDPEKSPVFFYLMQGLIGKNQ